MTSPDLFRLVFRYVNRGSTSVNGQVSVREEGKFSSCTNCEWGLLTPSFSTHTSQVMRVVDPACVTFILAPWEVYVMWVKCRLGGGLGTEPEHLALSTPGTERSQPVAFPPSTEPAFVTVPQRGFGEPFVLNPGTWALLVEAEGVLLVRQGPQQGRVGCGPQSLCTHPPPLSGLRGPPAQHLLRGSSPTASSNRGLYLPSLSPAPHREVRSCRMSWGWILRGPVLTSASLLQLSPLCSPTPGWLPFRCWN